MVKYILERDLRMQEEEAPAEEPETPEVEAPAEEEAVPEETTEEKCSE